jgi:hypothetical protein
LVHDEECKVATYAFDPHTEPRPHAGVLFEAGAIQTRRRLYSDTVIARRTADALTIRFGADPMGCFSFITTTLISV